ncbi:MAG: hypothetical protein WBQ10_11820 [Terriglobales bacterium]
MNTIWTGILLFFGYVIGAAMLFAVYWMSAWLIELLHELGWADVKGWWRFHVTHTHLDGTPWTQADYDRRRTPQGYDYDERTGFYIKKGDQ